MQSAKEKKKKRKDSAGSDDTASMIKGGEYTTAQATAPKCDLMGGLVSALV